MPAAKGIVLNEPSVIALNSRTNDVLAMGREAWKMIGRTPSYIVAVRPLRKGAITDFEVTQEMIRLLLKRVGVSRFNRPRVVICVPSAITAVEKRAVTEAARKAGAAEAQLIEQPMAAAIGAGLPINEPMANMVVDIGGGTSETALDLARRCGRAAGGARRARSTSTPRSSPTSDGSTGSPSASRPRRRSRSSIGSAAPTPDEVRAEVRGRELMSGLPKTVILSAAEVRSAIAEPVTSMVDSVISCVAEAPPELAQDLIEQGIHLVGGGSLLKGLDVRRSTPRPTFPCAWCVSRSSRSCSAPGGSSSPTRNSATCSWARVAEGRRPARSAWSNPRERRDSSAVIEQPASERLTSFDRLGLLPGSGESGVREVDALPLLEVEDIDVRFGGVVALDGLTFEVDEGQICALIGPNGAGKTTMFNVVSRIYEPARGSVRFDGTDLLALPPHRICRSRRQLGRSRTWRSSRACPCSTT